MTYMPSRVFPRLAAIALLRLMLGLTNWLHLAPLCLRTFSRAWHLFALHCDWVLSFSALVVEIPRNSMHSVFILALAGLVRKCS